LKYWAKRHELIGTFTFSTYAFTMLIIFFLQRRKILPTFRRMQKLAKEKIQVHKWNFGFCDDPTLMRSSSELSRATTEELIRGFFRYSPPLSDAEIHPNFYLFYCPCFSYYSQFNF